MRSLTEVYDHIATKDADLEKQAAVLIKQAEEEDAAGRIMARGFADELNKLADAYGNNYNPLASGRGGRQGGAVPKVPPATDSNAPGQAIGKKTRMNPVTGAHQNPGQPKPAPAARPRTSMTATAPKPMGT